MPENVPTTKMTTPLVTVDHPDTVRLNRLIAVLRLQVVRDTPSSWTCWLELPCIPERSQTTDVRQFIDDFAHYDKK
jgi:hypothetical protein